MAKGWGPSLVAGGFAGCVYVSTAAPGLVWGDGIELAAVCASLGIAHPTGYPLFTLLGHLFTHLPVGEIPFRVTLFCAVTMAAVVVVMHHLLARGLAARTVEAETLLRRLWRVGAPLAGALAFAWSLGPWTHATRTEVYALQLLLQSCMVLLAWHCLGTSPTTGGTEGGQEDGASYGASWVLGLGLTHHLLTFVLVPLWGAVVWHHMGRRPGAWRRRCLGHGMALLLGLTPILYLPLRAQQEPLLSWGHPATVEGLWWTLSGGDFPDDLLLVEQPGRVFTVKSFAAHVVHRGRSLANYLVGMVLPSTGLPSMIRRLAFFLASLCWLRGALYLWRRHRPFAVPWALCLGLYAGVLVTYNIGDITDYQLGFYALLWPVLWWGACFGAEGRTARQKITAGSWWRRIARGGPGRSSLAMVRIGMLLLPPALLMGNYALADRSDDDLVDRFAAGFLQHLPSEAILLTQGDFATATAWYRQTVVGERRDILVYCLDFFYDPWYEEVLSRQDLRGRKVATSTTRGELGESFLEALDRLIVTPNAETPVLIMPSPRQARSLARRFELTPVVALLDADELALFEAKGWRAPQPLVFELRRLGETTEVAVGADDQSP